MVVASRPLPVETIEAPTFREFEARYTSKPFLVKGFTSKWRAHTLWQDPDYFKGVAGDRLVPVKRMQNGSYRGAPTSQMKLSDYLDAVSKAPVGSDRLYFSETPLDRTLPELLADIETPPYVGGNDHASVIYFGNDVFSQIHYHAYGKALLCQITGHKRVTLFAPDQSKYLYPVWNFSGIDCFPVDLQKYPKYARATGYECLVEAGDLLYIPIYWWHGVHTPELSAAITYFWADDWKKRWFSPRGIPKVESVLLQAARACPPIVKLSKYGRMHARAE
jgi:hypothetical protein